MEPTVGAVAPLPAVLYKGLGTLPGETPGGRNLVHDTLVRRLVRFRADPRGGVEVGVPQRCGLFFHREVADVDGSGLEDLELLNLERLSRVPVVLYLAVLDPLQPECIAVPVALVYQLLPQRGLALGLVLTSQHALLLARVCGLLPIEFRFELSTRLF